MQRVIIKANIKENTSKRAGIEGTNSALKRKYSLGKLKVRGQHKCTIVTGLIVTVHNFVKFAKLVLKKPNKVNNVHDISIGAPILQ